MPRSKRDVEHALSKKGFRVNETHHHQFRFYASDGRKTNVVTKTSHTPKMREIPDNLLTQMAKQCKMTKAEFLQVVDCEIDQSGYEALMTKRGVVI